jgi:hypothetical protein
MPVKDCEHEMLAAGPIAGVHRCTQCGVVSIHLGATTLRLAPAACESLWATLGEALLVLHERLEGASPLVARRAGAPRGSA